MANIPDITPCAAPPDGKRAALAADPFVGLFYHFGQLLGVDDFETEQSYHRGKTRLHNAWLHRDGVVWGFAVGWDEPRGEIRVAPGLALDGAGHELHLDAHACLTLADWFRANEDKLAIVDEHGTATIDAHVLARFKACLARPVPAMSEPCVGAQVDTAYSRAVETVEILLLPGAAPSRELPYHRLRLLFALDEPRGDGVNAVSADEQAVLDARAEILALPSVEQPRRYLEWFRKLAAADEMDLAPATVDGSQLLFPAPDDAGVVLANLRVRLQRGADGRWTPAAAAVDNTVRPSHVATATIQELLCGPLFLAAAGGPAIDHGPPDTAMRIVRASVTIDSEKRALRFTTTAPLLVSSAVLAKFSLATLDRLTGWTTIGFEEPVETQDEAPGTAVVLHLRTTLPDTADVVRFVAVGTGPQPILGADRMPLAGANDDPPGAGVAGRDFVHHVLVEPIPL